MQPRIHLLRSDENLSGFDVLLLDEEYELERVACHFPFLPRFWRVMRLTLANFNRFLRIRVPSVNFRESDVAIDRKMECLSLYKTGRKEIRLGLPQEVRV